MTPYAQLPMNKSKEFLRTVGLSQEDFLYHHSKLEASSLDAATRNRCFFDEFWHWGQGVVIWPLPLGAVYNQRSLVALDNLVDFIITCISHPQAANETFLVSDGHDLSTTELVRGMAQAVGVSASLLPLPVWALQAGATLLGKGEAVQRLCGNLQVDISKARKLLGWVPPVSVADALKATARGLG